ncbi:unnamed protein product [Caenorhabditis nigoni]
MDVYKTIRMVFEIVFGMKILTALLLILLVASSRILAGEERRRCRTSKQCDYQSVCEVGYCYSIDEMFDKYGMR